MHNSVRLSTFTFLCDHLPELKMHPQYTLTAHPLSSQSLATTTLLSVSVDDYYDWLILLSIASSKFVHGIARVRISMLYKAK